LPQRCRFLWLLLAFLAAEPLSAQPDRRMSELLERYAGGDYAGAAEALTEITDYRSALRQLDKIAVPWIRSAGPEEMPRRRLIVAGFAIETASAGLHQWQEARTFIEWACVLLRAGGLPRPVERAWHLAAVALAQGAHDPDLLAHDFTQAKRGPREMDHLRHSAFRFPDDDRLRLARATVDEVRTLGSDPKHPRVSSFEQGQQALLRPFTAGEPTPVEVFDRATAKQMLSVSSRTHQPVLYAARRSTWLWDLTEQWKDLVPRPSVGSEAAIHLANTYLRLGRQDLALEALDHTPQPSGDAALIYLAQYLRGRAAEANGNLQMAEDAYRAALAAVPRAQSAAIALASLLFLSDSRDEAIEIVGDLFSTSPVVDPWKDYQAGDFRFWPQRVAELREAYRD
jgi:tetratricopeptide (TPR) repeat protein